MKDVALWTQITDLRIAQQGPALASQSRGETREVVRDVGAGGLMNGKITFKVDPLTGNALAGEEVLLHELCTRFGPMTRSKAIESVENFMTFKRRSGENIDNMIIRFEETYCRANREGGMVFNAVALNHLLIQVVGVKAEFHVLLNDFNRALPSNEAEHTRFLELLQRHLQRKERFLKGRAPLNFAGDKHSSRPRYPAWETAEGEYWDENEVWQYDEEQAWYGQGTDEQYYWEEDETACLDQAEEENTHLGPTEAETATVQDESEACLAYLIARRKWNTFEGKAKVSHLSHGLVAGSTRPLWA
eukprot:3898082-Amphidinium_carterae.1